jgi:MFS family permease
MRATLWNRSFLLLWGLTFLTFFAAFQLFPTAPLRLRELGASLEESGRFLTVFTIGSAGGALLTGQLGDRIGHRRMTLICTALFTLIMASYGFLKTRWGFYLFAPIHGVVWSGLITATVAQLGALIPEERRAEGLSWYGLASPGGVVLGPTIGVWIFRRFGFGWMCAGLVLAFALLALLARQLPLDTHLDEGRKPPPFQLPDRVVWPLAAILFCVALPYGALNSYSTQEGLALKTSWPAATLSCLAVGMVLMRLWMGWRGFSENPVRKLPMMLLISALGLAWLASPFGSLSRQIFAGLIFGAGYSMVYTLLNTTVLNLVRPERRGAAFGTFMFGFDAGIGLGSYALGQFMGKHGFRAGWALGVICILAALPLALRVVKRSRALKLDAEDMIEKPNV